MLSGMIHSRVKGHSYQNIMSTELPKRNRVSSSKLKITIVAATYNEKYTNALVQNCLAELSEGSPDAQVELVRVPGAFEVPVMVKRVIELSEVRPSIVIALGVILRGSTAHADLIGSSITNQLMSIACDTLVPVIHEVLLLDNEEQAFARCVAASLNRGREAGMAAISMMDLVDENRDKEILPPKTNPFGDIR